MANLGASVYDAKIRKLKNEIAAQERALSYAVASGSVNKAASIQGKIETLTAEVARLVAIGK